MRRTALTLVILLGLTACSRNAAPDPETLPPDLQVDYRWGTGVSLVGPGYLACRIRLQATGAGTIGCTMGHPSAGRQEEWRQSFGVSADDLQSLYVTMHRAGVFTRTWQQAAPVPGGPAGPSLSVVAEGSEYSVPSGLADAPAADSIAAVYEQIDSMVPEAIWDDLEASQARYLEDHGS